MGTPYSVDLRRRVVAAVEALRPACRAIKRPGSLGSRSARRLAGCNGRNRPAALRQGRSDPGEGQDDQGAHLDLCPGRSALWQSRTAGGAVLASRDRRHKHPVRHLRDFAGILQADAYNGYNELCGPSRSPGDHVGAMLSARKTAVL